MLITFLLTLFILAFIILDHYTDRENVGRNKLKDTPIPPTCKIEYKNSPRPESFHTIWAIVEEHCEAHMTYAQMGVLVENLTKSFEELRKK